MYYLIHVDNDANIYDNIELFMVIDQAETPDAFRFDIVKRIMEQTLRQNKISTAYNYRNDVRIYKYNSVREAIERNPAAEVMVSSNVDDIMDMQTQPDDGEFDALREKYKYFITNKKSIMDSRATCSL